jgi:hypothetical protein
MGIPNDDARDQPDVALNAAGEHDPYLLCLEGSCVPDSQGFISLFLIGGTSASSPSFAGIMALVDQQHGPQGQANYVLYRLAAAESSSLSQCNASKSTTLPVSTCVFNDVTIGNNSVPGQTGFEAGTGYDLATGLGSVNANNLVNQWSSINFRATTATLTPGTITGTHGSPVSLGVSVAPNSGSGTPTGDVSLQTGLIAAPGFIDAFPPMPAGFLTLNNGSSSASVSNLPGGSYTLTAQYSGDTIFSPSPLSSPINVNISSENSSTALTLLTADQNGNAIPFTGGPFGGFVYLRGDVSGQSGHGIPTGIVAFADSNSRFGSLNLNSQGNTVTPDGYFGFSIGQHALTAQYEGDNSFDSSNSSPAADFTITKASSTSVLTPISGAIQGTTVTLTANVTSPAFAGAPFESCGDMPCQSVNNFFGNDFPSGTVTFFSGSTQLGTAPVGTSGPEPTANGVTAVASLTTSALSAGVNSITARYSGDSNYMASSAPPISVSVDSDFAFAAANSNVTVSAPGGSGTDVLTVTGQPGYNSTVTFSSVSCSGLPPLAQCSFTPASITGSGSTTVTVTTKAPTPAVAHLEWSSVGFIFAGVLLLNFRQRRFRRVFVFSILLAGTAIASISCGGGSSGGGGGSGSPGTPLGSYPIVVTATTSDGAVSHTANFTLMVQ